MSQRATREARVAGVVEGPGGVDGGASAVWFACAARLAAETARAEGWQAPGFRSPPRLAGAERTVRRRADGGAVVAVRVVGRPWAAVLSDLVEGVVVANRFRGTEAHHCRARLWAALAPADERAA
jgi:hypothetical protein